MSLLQKPTSEDSYVLVCTVPISSLLRAKAGTHYAPPLLDPCASIVSGDEFAGVIRPIWRFRRIDIRYVVIDSDGESMRIAALTCRSFYSPLRAAVSVPRWMQKAAEYGYGAVALADVNSMSGVVDLCQAAEKMGIRPVVGVESLTEPHRAILLAEDDRGYGNLCRITTARNLRADFDLIEQLKRDNRGVVCICAQGKLLVELRELLPRGYLFAGCRDPQEAESAMARGLELIAWTGSRWLEEKDIEVAKLLARIWQLSVAGAGPGDGDSLGTLVPVPEAEQKFRPCPRALANADQLVERCRFQLLKSKPILPRITLDRGTTGDRELARLCHVGLA